MKIISSYTCEAKDTKYSPYKLLNKNLVSDNRQEGINNISKYLYILLKSLRKLDKYYPTGNSKYLYRCINAKVEINNNIFKPKLVPYITGNKKTFWGFTSTSPDVMTSYTFLKEEEKNKSGTIFTLTGKVWGYDITLFNCFKENEILLEPERKFVIDEVLPPVNDIIHIRCDIQETPLVLLNLYRKIKVDLEERINKRGKMQLIVCENFKKIYNLESDKVNDIKTYKQEKEIYDILEKNIECYKYFNVVFLNYQNKEEALIFLKTFIENSEENGIINNNSEYPFFVFFKNENFNKEILYSYYLEKTNDINISSYYDLNSQNVYFINNKESEIKHLLMTDIIDYYYKYDDYIEKDVKSHKIGILFMGEIGSGKSTFINYLLVKKRAYSCSIENNEPIIEGEYNHSKYPILMKETIGFEINNKYHHNKIFEILKKDFDKGLNKKYHIVFYLIPGIRIRHLNNSFLEILIKLEQYNIHYYLIMTKDHEESRDLKRIAFRMLRSIIRRKDFREIETNLKEEELIEYLERIKNKLENITFSVDVFKRDSETIGSLLNIIYDDLKIDKWNHEKIIKELIENKSNILLDFSNSSNEIFKDKCFDIDESKQREALKAIEEAKDISPFKKLFFSYNNEVEENRKKMIEKILSIYKSKNLSVDLIEKVLLNKEKNKWFYSDDFTDELGNQLINICQKEINAEKYINHCINFNKSIDEFGKYVKEFIDFKLNGYKIPYDCELNTS